VILDDADCRHVGIHADHVGAGCVSRCIFAAYATFRLYSGRISSSGMLVGSFISDTFFVFPALACRHQPCADDADCSAPAGLHHRKQAAVSGLILGLAEDGRELILCSRSVRFLS
jgi:hypothetical protein